MNLPSHFTNSNQIVDVSSKCRRMNENHIYSILLGTNRNKLLFIVFFEFKIHFTLSDLFFLSPLTRPFSFLSLKAFYHFTILQFFLFYFWNQTFIPNTKTIVFMCVIYETDSFFFLGYPKLMKLLCKPIVYSNDIHC